MDKPTPQAQCFSTPMPRQESVVAYVLVLSWIENKCGFLVTSTYLLPSVKQQSTETALVEFTLSFLYISVALHTSINYYYCSFTKSIDWRELWLSTFQNSVYMLAQLVA